MAYSQYSININMVHRVILPSNSGHAAK